MNSTTSLLLSQVTSRACCREFHELTVCISRAAELAQVCYAPFERSPVPLYIGVSVVKWYRERERELTKKRLRKESIPGKVGFVLSVELYAVQEVRADNCECVNLDDSESIGDVPAVWGFIQESTSILLPWSLAQILDSLTPPETAFLADPSTKGRHLCRNGRCVAQA